MNKMQAQVEEFHKVFNLPAPSSPLAIDANIALRCKLIVEESSELFEAMEDLWMGNPIPMVDNLVDLLYFVFGTGVAMGIDLEPFFEAVHKANMDKLQRCPEEECSGGYIEPDSLCGRCEGRGLVATYREDGKVAKPEGWQPANLELVWRRVYG